MTQERIRREDIAPRGNAWYDNHIRSLVETDENIGKIITIDVETGDYEISERRDSAEATLKLLAQNPGTQVLQKRIGYAAVDTFGGVRLMPSKQGRQEPLRIIAPMRFPERITL